MQTSDRICDYIWCGDVQDGEMAEQGRHWNWSRTTERTERTVHFRAFVICLYAASGRALVEGIRDTGKDRTQPLLPRSLWVENFAFTVDELVPGVTWE